MAPIITTPPPAAEEDSSSSSSSSSSSAGRNTDYNDDVDNDAATLALPRILCLHGGGTNARIFRAQCRVLRARLARSFRLVFADAPFASPPGPDVESVYGGWGPFRSWIPLPPARPGPGLGDGLGKAAAVVDMRSIDASIAAAVRADDERAGATGPWVGVLGFSQGAAVAARLLMRQQQQQQQQQQRRQGHSQGKGGGCLDPGRVPGYRFAVLMAGQPFLMMLDTGLTGGVAVGDPGWLLRLPTIHVHGLQDHGLERHRSLFHCCQKSTARLVEWDGGHRVPIKTKDVAAVVAQIQDVASECGVGKLS